MGPTIDALAQEYDGKAVIGKLDVDSEPGLAKEYGIEGLPTLVFFKDGKEVDRVLGAPSKSKIIEMLDGLIGG